MNPFKSHFWYNKSQRNGILFLLLLIIVFQIFFFFIPKPDKKWVDVTATEISDFQRQIDSLKVIELENRKPNIFPFNPNYISDFKGAQLGMSVDEIDRLHLYRSQNKFANSIPEFQKVTQISDSLLNEISPYFKFPDWVTNQNPSLRGTKQSFNKKPSHKISTTDINKATAKDFQTISGIGEKLSERIINYRKRLQGFTFENQLYEVWKIDKAVMDQVLTTFKIETKPTIKKININTASFKEILKNPYIDYELCKAIFNYKDQIAEYQTLTELKQIRNFPADKYDRIVLYLLVE